MADTRTYIKLHDGMPDHPKIDALSDRAFRLLVSTWCWCSRHLTNGHVPIAVWNKRASVRERRELVEAGLVEVLESSIYMHDYLDHQRSKDEVLALREKRQEAGKQGGKAKANRLANARSVAKQTPTKNVAVSVSETHPESDNPFKPSSHPPDVDMDADFEQFWKSYPKRNGKRLHKAKARATWKRLTKVDREQIPKAVANYAAACESAATIAADPHRWLGRKEFAEWQEPASVSPRTQKDQTPYISPAWGQRADVSAPPCEHSNPMCADCRRATMQRIKSMAGSIGEMP